MQPAFTKEQALHQVLLNWLPWNGRRAPLPAESVQPAPAEMAKRMQTATAQQLSMSLRLQGVEPEDETMLASLESLMLAGEISFNEFIGRVQNLFPKAMEALDVSMRMKIASLTLLEAPQTDA